jgi:hypothetical protein
MNDQKETLLFVYLKMSKEQLQISLPINYEIDEKKNYLCVFINKNGRDYLSQNTEENIKNIIKDAKMMNLFNNNYEKLKKVFLYYTEEKFEEHKKFVLEQFNDIEEL